MSEVHAMLYAHNTFQTFPVITYRGVTDNNLSYYYLYHNETLPFTVKSLINHPLISVQTLSRILN